MSMLEVSHVSKSYGSKSVIADVNLAFEENKIYGLLGRNGAGKAHCSILLPTGFFPVPVKLKLIQKTLPTMIQSSA